MRNTHRVHSQRLLNWIASSTSGANRQGKSLASDVGPVQLPLTRGRSETSGGASEYDSENETTGVRRRVSGLAKRVARDADVGGVGNANNNDADLGAGNAGAGFMTGRERLALDATTRRQGQDGSGSAAAAYATLGPRKQRTSNGFIPPYANSHSQGQVSSQSITENDQFQQSLSNAPSFVRTALGANATNNTKGSSSAGSSSKQSKSSSGEASGPPSLVDSLRDEEGKLPGRLAACDPQLIESILHEVLDGSPGVRWDDIAGLEFAKKNVYEIVVWPLLRPQFFRGLRGPPKGLLLFGPPGTGKTLIGKAIATESNARFFSISASSLTSKWHGQGEKLVRTLFAVAAHLEPSVIFIDEIDSLLSQRQDAEFEASRRIKTEFLVQLDGVASSAGKRDDPSAPSSEPRILVIGATNRPHELDEAARRRLVKRLYIPLPDAPARRQLVTHLLSREAHAMRDKDIDRLVEQTDGYSGADLHALCKEAAFGPLRELKDITSASVEDVRPIEPKDFDAALLLVRASVDQKDLKMLEDWNRTFGSFPINPPNTGNSDATNPTMASDATKQ